MSRRNGQLHARGLCIDCQAPHTDVNPHTQQPMWRCRACRIAASSVEAKRQRARRQLQRERAA